MSLFSSFIAVSVVLCLCLGSSTVYGWGCPGHMMTAHVARRLVEPNVGGYFSSLVPIMAQQYPHISLPSLTEAACWADDIKSQTHKYNNWHFADMCFSADGTACPAQSSGELLHVLPQLIANITSPTATDDDRASSLFFILHLVGDLHQPLHLAGEWSAHFPDGDEGGNKFNIQMPHVEGGVNHSLNLHRYCDDVGMMHFYAREARPMTAEETSLFDTTAQALIDKYPFNASDVQFTDSSVFAQWANVNFQIGKDAVYLDGQLQPDSQVTTQYVSDTRDALQKQIAIGGSRLASVLTFIYQAIHPATAQIR